MSKLPTPENGIEIKKSICTVCDSLNQCGLDLYVKQGEDYQSRRDQGESSQQGQFLPPERGCHPPVCVP